MSGRFIDNFLADLLQRQFSSFFFRCRELLLNNNLLRVLPYEIGKLFHLQILGLHGNPLGKDVMSIYNEPNGTQKLLTYLLDNLTGKWHSPHVNFYNENEKMRQLLRQTEENKVRCENITRLLRTNNFENEMIVVKTKKGSMKKKCGGTNSLPFQMLCANESPSNHLLFTSISIDSKIMLTPVEILSMLNQS